MSDSLPRLNILFLMADQHRHDYYGAAGATWVDTPNLDRLAASGTRFTQCTVNSPVCAASRIALATGLQPGHLGATDNERFLPASVPTYYQRLRDHGYHVGLVGKADLAKPATENGRHGDRPVLYSYGFTRPVECEGKMHAAKAEQPRGPYGHWLQEKGLFEEFRDDYRRRAKLGYAEAAEDSVLETEAFEDSYIGRRACEWLRDASPDHPWHLFVSFVGPHDPFDPPTEYADRYRRREMPEAIPMADDDRPRRYEARGNRDRDKSLIRTTRRQYCASMELIDDQIGRILDTLEETGQRENTIILYASDHGEMLGDHGHYTKGVPYEASIRVPLIVSGPGLPAGEVSDALVELIDLNPTICDLANVPPLQNIDAISFLPLMQGQTTSHRSETLSEMRGFFCLRTDRYKLVQNINDCLELYDLEKDPDEQTNIAERNPDLMGEIKQRLKHRFQHRQWLG